MSVGVCMRAFRHASMCLREEVTQMEETIFKHEEMDEPPMDRLLPRGTAVVLDLFPFSSAL